MSVFTTEHLLLAQEHVVGYLSSLFLGVTSLPPSVYSVTTTWPWLLFLQLAAFQFFFNLSAKKFLFMPVAEYLFGKLQSNAPNSQFKKRTEKKEKFAQACVEAMFYSWYFVMGVMIIYAAPWVWPSTEWWVAQDNEGHLIQPLNVAETTFYIAYAARYFAFFVCVGFVEPKKKDFAEMQIHHVTTVILIFLSFLSGFVRVGFVVMVLLDFADTFLHIAKACKYIEEGRKMAKITTFTENASLCADIWFALFAIAFTVTRLGMYGYVTWSVWVEATENWVQNEKYGLTRDMDYMSAIKHVGFRMEHGFLCQLLILVLFILMCVWEVMLMSAVWKVLSGNELKDNRSDSEAEEKEPEEKCCKCCKCCDCCWPCWADKEQHAKDE